MKFTLKVVILLLSILLITNNCIPAATSLKETLDSTIGSDSLSHTTLVSVSVRDAKAGTLIYQRYGNYLLHTASTLKAFTTPVALKYLGADSHLSTILYKSKKTGNMYLKLSGDPILTSNDLNLLIKKLPIKSIKGNIVIDDTSIDNLPWGVGWMWDDENNSLMPKYNAYNIDHNLISVKVIPTSNEKKVTVIVPPDYTVKIVNTAVTTANKNISNADKLKVERKPWIDPETIFVSGKVFSTTTITIPVGNPKNYFISILKSALNKNNISFDGAITTGKVPENIELVSSINHKVDEVVSYTCQESDNLGAEILLKLAGRKYTDTGTTNSGLKLMKDFYANLGAPITDQEIVDGSGASHNNLVQPNWMTKALVALYNSPMKDMYLESLAKPGQRGTLRYRLKTFGNKLHAKTGTMAGVSGLTGFLTARSGKIYAFSILIQNYKGTSTNAKELENKIIQTLYNY